MVVQARELPTTATGSLMLRRRTLAHLTVRTRMVAAVVVMSALAVLSAGGTAFALQARAIDARIDGSLTRAVAGSHKELPLSRRWLISLKS